MATDAREIVVQPETAEDSDPTKDWFDRCSLHGDYMVMIPDQAVEGYLRRAPENKICEDIDGIVYLSSPASLWHQFDVLLLSFLIQGFTADRPIDRLLSAPACLRVSESRFLEPDLFVVPNNPTGKFQGFFVDPPILIVVEVLSKSTRSHDLNRKAELYCHLEVEEIWFVDDRDGVLIVYRRTDQGYLVGRIRSGPFQCQPLPGFWLDVSWLWARPQPVVLQCLEAILAGPPA